MSNADIAKVEEQLGEISANFKSFEQELEEEKAKEKPDQKIIKMLEEKIQQAERDLEAPLAKIWELERKDK